MTADSDMFCRVPDWQWAGGVVEEPTSGKNRYISTVRIKSARFGVKPIKSCSICHTREQLKNQKGAYTDMIFIYLLDQSGFGWDGRW